MNGKDFAITFEIEPIVKLHCRAFDCKNNARRPGSATCNLKFLMIGAAGQCTSYEKEQAKKEV